MGVVCRAEDTKLRRQIALRVLPDDFAQDAERLARFKQGLLPTIPRVAN